MPGELHRERPIVEVAVFLGTSCLPLLLLRRVRPLAESRAGLDAVDLIDGVLDPNWAARGRLFVNVPMCFVVGYRPGGAHFVSHVFFNNAEAHWVDFPELSFYLERFLRIWLLFVRIKNVIEPV